MVSPLRSRNLTPTPMRRLEGGEGRGGWWSSGGIEEGLDMIATEPVSEL